jgi:uncharacterized protein (DUF1778 family)
MSYGENRDRPRQPQFSRNSHIFNQSENLSDGGTAVIRLTVRGCAVQFAAEDFPVVRKSTRSTRLEARLSPETLATVRRAAEIEGRSVSDFVVDAAHEAAQRTIAETQIIRLSVADQRRLAEALARPPKPAAALRRARAAHRRLIAATK